MTSAEVLAYHDPPVRRHQPVRRQGLQGMLLTSGLLSSVLYVCIDLTSAMLNPGYHIVNQAISELSALGAPTRWLWMWIGPLYNILLAAFGIGVIRMAGSNRAMKATGVLIAALAISGMLWSIFPMHPRGTEFSWTDVGHIVLAASSVIAILSFVTVGAWALGRQFRKFSLVTAGVLLLAGLGAFAYASRLGTGDPTPGLGLIERANVYGYLLWIAVYSTALQRRERRKPEPRSDQYER